MANREREKVPCRHCGTPTAYLGTRCCDPCYLAANAVRDRPEVTRKLLAEQDAARGAPTADSMLMEALRLAAALKFVIVMLLGERKDAALLGRIDAFCGILRSRFNLRE